MARVRLEVFVDTKNIDAAIARIQQAFQRVGASVSFGGVRTTQPTVVQQLPTYTELLRPTAAGFVSYAVPRAQAVQTTGAPTHMPSWMVEKYGIWGAYALGYSFELGGRALERFGSAVLRIGDTVMETATKIAGAEQRIRAVTGFAPEQMRWIREQVSGAARFTGVPIEELMPVGYLIATRGFALPQAYPEMIKYIGMFSQITQTPVQEAANMLLTFYQQMMAQFTPQQQAMLAPYMFGPFVSLLTEVWTKSPYEAQSLLQSLRYAVPIAMMGGMDVNELMAVLAATFTQYAQGSRVGQRIRQALIKMLTLSEPQQQQLAAQLGLRREEIDWTRRGLIPVLETIFKQLRQLPPGQQIGLIREVFGQVRTTEYLAAAFRALESAKWYYQQFSAGRTPLPERFEEYIRSPLGNFQRALAEYSTALAQAKDAVLDFQASVMRIKTAFLGIFTGLPAPAQQAVLWTGAAATGAGKLLEGLGTLITVGAGLRYLQWMSRYLTGQQVRGIGLLRFMLEPLGEILAESAGRIGRWIRPLFFERRMGAPELGEVGWFAGKWRFSWPRTLATIGYDSGLAYPWIVGAHTQGWSWGQFGISMAQSAWLPLLLALQGHPIGAFITGGIAIGMNVWQWLHARRLQEQQLSKQLEVYKALGQHWMAGVAMAKRLPKIEPFLVGLMEYVEKHPKIKTPTGEYIDLSKLGLEERFLAALGLYSQGGISNEVLYSIERATSETAANTKKIDELVNLLTKLGVSKEEAERLKTQQPLEPISMRYSPPRNVIEGLDIAIRWKQFEQQLSSMLGLQKEELLPGITAITSKGVVARKVLGWAYEREKGRLTVFTPSGPEVFTGVRRPEDIIASYTQLEERARKFIPQKPVVIRKEIQKREELFRKVVPEKLEEITTPVVPEPLEPVLKAPERKGGFWEALKGGMRFIYEHAPFPLLPHKYFLEPRMYIPQFPKPTEQKAEVLFDALQKTLDERMKTVLEEVTDKFISANRHRGNMWIYS